MSAIISCAPSEGMYLLTLGALSLCRELVQNVLSGEAEIEPETDEDMEIDIMTVDSSVKTGDCHVCCLATGCLSLRLMLRVACYLRLLLQHLLQLSLLCCCSCRPLPIQTVAPGNESLGGLLALRICFSCQASQHSVSTPPC